MPEHNDALEAAALKPCPFCDNQPSFSCVETKDESRYVEKLLKCCSVEMSARLGWSRFSKMTERKIDEHLTSELTRLWNVRAEPDAAPATQPSSDAVREALQRLRCRLEVLLDEKDIDDDGFLGEIDAALAQPQAAGTRR